MSGVLNDMVVRIGAEAKPLQDALSKANDQLDTFAGYAEKAGKGLVALTAVGGIGKVAQQITEVALAAGQQAEELQQLAQITGRNTSSLQDWDVMLNRVGLSQNDLQMGMKTLAQKVEEAHNGAGAASDRFRQLNIDITKMRSTDEILHAIAEQSSKMAGGMEKSAAMTDLLGRMGARLIPAFEGGAKAIEAAHQKSEEMAKLSGVQLESLGRMDDSVDDLSKAWQRLGQQFGAFVAPSITVVSDAMQWLVSLGARMFKEMDTAADTMAIRFTHLALAINEAADVLFSTNLFSGDAWKQALSNIDMIDKEAARLIAKRRELANAPEGADTRANPNALIDSAKELAAARATADGVLRTTEAMYKAMNEQDKASTEMRVAQLAYMKQQYLVTDVAVVESSAKMAESLRTAQEKSLVMQIADYNVWAKKRIAMEQAGSKERETVEGQVNQKLVEMWGQVVLAQMHGDTERIKSAMAVAQARQEAATKEAEAGLANFQLYQRMIEREKQMDVEAASSRLAVIQAQESALGSQFQDHRRILDATLSAINAEAAKELASATITEQEKQAIRDKYLAQRLQAENQYTQAAKQVRGAELNDVARVADAQFNLMKAQQDQEFVLFRDTETLREAKQAALTAQYQADLVAAQDNANQRLAVEQNYQAQMLATSQQFPTFWQQQLQLIQQSAAFTWSSITTGFSSALASWAQGTATMAQFAQQMFNTILTSAINLVLQLGVQWALATLFKSKEDGKQTAAHLLMETAKTKITSAAEAARVAVVVAGAKTAEAVAASSLATMAALGAAALAIAAVALSVVVGVITAIGIALSSTPVTAPIGQEMIGAAIVAGTAGGFALAAGGLALGAAVAASSAALAGIAATPFATGGIVTGPTLALIGEAGPEAVIPLSKMDAMQNDRPVIVQNEIYLDGNQMTDYILEKMGPRARFRGVMV